MRPFRLLGWRLFYLGMTVGVLALGASLVSQFHYINAISVGLPAALVGAAMIAWPGVATLDSAELVLSRDWESMWKQARMRDKLIWLVALCLGVLVMMAAILMVLVAAES